MKKQKKIVYLYLNSKDRVIIDPQNSNDNICRWRNLPPIPAGYGKLSLINMSYYSSINRNNRLILSMESTSANGNSTCNELVSIGQLTTYSNVYFPNSGTSRRVHFYYQPHYENIELLKEAKELQNISIHVDFSPEVILPDRPILDFPNKLSFLFKFEYL